MNIMHLFLQGENSVVIYFPLTLPTTTGAPASTFLNRAVAGVTLAAGDAQISEDGAAFVNTTNTLAEVGGGLYSLTLTTAELTTAGNAGYFVIKIADQTATPEWEDLFILIRTRITLSHFFVLSNTDEEAVKFATGTGNRAGLYVGGVGTKPAIETVHPTSDTLLHNLFNIIQPSEPTSAIGSSSTFWAIAQHLYRRFFNKVTQTSTTQTVFRDDSSTILETMTCADDSVTQTKGKAS